MPLSEGRRSKIIVRGTVVGREDKGNIKMMGCVLLSSSQKAIDFFRAFLEHLVGRHPNLVG